MKDARRRFSGWSFAVGALVGGLAVLVPLVSIGKPARHAAAGTAAVVDLATARTEVAASPAVQSVMPSGTERRSRAPRPAPAKAATPRHSELEQPLD